jgi:hypothetical protein
MSGLTIVYTAFYYTAIIPCIYLNLDGYTAKYLDF